MDTKTQVAIFDPARRQKFLLCIRCSGAIQKSARDAGVSTSTIRHHLSKDVHFKAAYEEAMQDFKEAIEAEIQRRAIIGWEEEVYQQGNYVGTIRKFDPNLLAMLAKRHIPEYKEKHEVTHSIKNGTLAVPIQATERDWIKDNVTDAEFTEEDDIPGNGRIENKAGAGSEPDS